MDSMANQKLSPIFTYLRSITIVNAITTELNPNPEKKNQTGEMRVEEGGETITTHSVGGWVCGWELSFPHNAAERADFMFVFCGEERERERRRAQNRAHMTKTFYSGPTTDRPHYWVTQKGFFWIWRESH